MAFFRYIPLLLLVFWRPFSVKAQHLTKKETTEYIKKSPRFSIHNNNYFISGIPTNRAINGNNSGIKYQISFKQMITRTTLPWDTYLFLGYTQKAFWHVFEQSSPFKEINFNPALGLGKPVFNHENRLSGFASLAFNHHSNGRAGEESRSWNSFNLQYTTLLDEKTTFSAEAWVPFLYHDDNPDILDYQGLFKIKAEREFLPDKLSAEIQLQKGLTWGWEGAVRSRIYYSPFPHNNQYFMIEWYLGEGESLIDYSEFRSMIRIGYVIKTEELDFLKKKSKKP